MNNTNSNQSVLTFAAFLTLLFPALAFPQTKEADDVRKRFTAEAQPYLTTVKSLATVYDPRLERSSLTDFFVAMSDLTSLDAVCRKYSRLTTHPSLVNSQLNHRPTDWCKIAAQRNELIKKA